MDETARLKGWTISMTKDGFRVDLSGHTWGEQPSEYWPQAVEAMADGLRIGGFEAEVTYTYESKVRS